MPKKPTTTAKTAKPDPNDSVFLNFNIPIEMPSVYATNILIQPGEFEVIISFFEVQPPLMASSDPKENLELLKKTGLRADCVSRVTVAKDRIEGFANAMKQMATDLKNLKTN